MERPRRSSCARGPNSVLYHISYYFSVQAEFIYFVIIFRSLSGVLCFAGMNSAVGQSSDQPHRKHILNICRLCRLQPCLMEVQFGQSTIWGKAEK